MMRESVKQFSLTRAALCKCGPLRISPVLVFVLELANATLTCDFEGPSMFGNR